VNFSDLEKKVKELASTDIDFRKMLLENPKKAIMERMNCMTPEGIQINVVEDSSNTFNLVLPPKSGTDKIYIW
jgi:hypothetical protein